ncbi:MAG: serine/threonine-protein kinase [Candidatus Melainabacteria bacterium]|nr:serine/threonine-protein kinase [Candidatus Melainabacteria bacterium]
MPTASRFFKELDFSDFYQRHKQEGWLVNWALLVTTAVTASLPVLYVLAPELFVLTILLGLLTVGITLPALAFLSLGKIKLDSRGIEISRLGSLDEKLYAWSDLTKITFAKNGQPSLEPNQLVLEFHRQPALVLELSAISKLNLEAVLSQASYYCPKVAIHPSETIAALGIKERRLIDPLDFTELWQSHLDQRFASTNFIPLEQGHRLQQCITVLAQVASGGMSAVYLAKHDQRGPVVLKESVFSGSRENDKFKKAVELFEREATLLTKISHPRIVKIYDYFVEDNRHYLLLEHIKGKTLRNFTAKHGAVSEVTIIEWGIQMAQVLHFLHHMEPPIVHRDFTPDNVIICEDGKIRLIDFGASSIFLGTATGTVVGKIAYMPPEQIKGKSNLASDIYAFGCLMYFLATGKNPLPYEQNYLPKDSTIKSINLKHLVNDCLKLDLKDRTIRTKEIIARLESLISSRNSHAER